MRHFKPPSLLFSFFLSVSQLDDSLSLRNSLLPRLLPPEWSRNGFCGFYKTREITLAWATTNRIICYVPECDNDQCWGGLKTQLHHQIWFEKWGSQLICQCVDLHTDCSCSDLQDLLKVVLELSQQTFCTVSKWVHLGPSWIFFFLQSTVEHGKSPVIWFHAGITYRSGGWQIWKALLRDWDMFCRSAIDQAIWSVIWGKKSVGWEVSSR